MTDGIIHRCVPKPSEVAKPLGVPSSAGTAKASHATPRKQWGSRHRCRLPARLARIRPDDPEGSSRAVPASAVCLACCPKAASPASFRPMTRPRRSAFRSETGFVRPVREPSSRRPRRRFALRLPERHVHGIGPPEGFSLRRPALPQQPEGAGNIAGSVAFKYHESRLTGPIDGLSSQPRGRSTRTGFPTAFRHVVRLHRLIALARDVDSGRVRHPGPNLGNLRREFPQSGHQPVGLSSISWRPTPRPDERMLSSIASRTKHESRGSACG